MTSRFIAGHMDRFSTYSAENGMPEEAIRCVNDAVKAEMSRQLKLLGPNNECFENEPMERVMGASVHTCVNRLKNGPGSIRTPKSAQAGLIARRVVRILSGRGDMKPVSREWYAKGKRYHCLGHCSCHCDGGCHDCCGYYDGQHLSPGAYQCFAMIGCPTQNICCDRSWLQHKCENN